MFSHFPSWDLIPMWMTNESQSPAPGGQLDAEWGRDLDRPRGDGRPPGKMDASRLTAGSLHFGACPLKAHPRLRPQAWRKSWPVGWVSVGCGHHGVTLGHEPQSSVASHTGRFKSPWKGGGRGHGLAILPKSQCSVTLAQAGNWSKSNMTRPQVLMARNEQVIPMTFIISPVFIWKRTGSKLAPLGLPGCQNKGEWDAGIHALEKGTKAVGWASRSQARLCPHPTPRQSNFTSSASSTSHHCSKQPGKQAGQADSSGPLGHLENWASGRQASY